MRRPCCRRQPAQNGIKVTTVGLDRLHALHLAVDLVRRGSTISLSGVSGGMTDLAPMLTMFDKQQANVRR